MTNTEQPPFLHRKTFINSPITLCVGGTPLRGFRQRLRALFGRVDVAPPIVITDCQFYGRLNGTAIPTGLGARLQLCLRILRGEVEAIQGGGMEPAIRILEETGI